MTNTKEAMREKFNEKFPPPMLLGQNQERVADFWLAELATREREIVEEIEKIMPKTWVEGNTNYQGRIMAEKIIDLIQSHE